jgi:HEAT repeat protein
VQAQAPAVQGTRRDKAGAGQWRKERAGRLLHSPTGYQSPHSPHSSTLSTQPAEARFHSVVSLASAMWDPGNVWPTATSRGCRAVQSAVRCLFALYDLSVYNSFEVESFRIACPPMLSKLKSILDALRPSRGPSVANLLDQLSHTDARSRWEAVEALGPHSGQARVTEALVEALGDPHPFVRWQAVESLAQSKDERTLVLLKAALSSKNAHRRSSVADALGRLGDKRATTALSRALASRNAGVRCSAAEALGRLGDPTALPKLNKALRDQDAHVRRAVVNALGAIGGSEAVPALLTMLEDKSALVRASAAAALQKIADPRATHALRQALHDSDPGVRWYAVRALGTFGDAETLPFLVPLLSDETEVFGVSIADAARSAMEVIERRQRDQEQAHRLQSS